VSKDVQPVGHMRASRLDQCDLLDGQEPLSQCDDVFHVTSRATSVDVMSRRYLKTNATLAREMVLGKRVRGFSMFPMYSSALPETPSAAVLVAPTFAG
jgi:hypothetical protein